MSLPEHDPVRHGPLDDAQGLLTGTLLCALALQFLRNAGFITGQTAGLALLISYTTGIAFGWVFFVINLPFYWLGYRRIGLGFTLKSFLSVGLLSAFSALLPRYLSLGAVDPLLAGILFGVLSGVGLLILFRHGSSLGGIGILAVMVQDRFGVRAGWLQMGFDAALFLVAAMILPLDRVLWSLPGVVVLNLIIAINHRRDRYVAT
ncbi:YitT family protein [Tabrizicola sp. J26]|uniref:YitT family protein n=1 Tax=Alitabrizicola rongguiensis TaxID=2909234 RepID=UPI001F448205|nr:YitT family protein [Tabrizicola rongguiensis]MCF1709904.1 YitT family protein [Tabrizicola rongguiensis]